MLELSPRTSFCRIMRLSLVAIIIGVVSAPLAGADSDEERCCETCQEKLSHLGQRVEELERQNDARQAMMLDFQAWMAHWETVRQIAPSRSGKPRLASPDGERSWSLHTASFVEAFHVERQRRKLQPTEVTQLITSDPDVTITGDDVVSAMDTLWVLICSALVMFMQAGFALVECGSCRAKNMQYVLLKNVSDMMIGLIGWWVCGWSIAFGSASKNFVSLGLNPIDNTGAFTGGIESGKPGPVPMTSWFFQWAFCSVATTIVSGAVAERIRLNWYMLYSFIMTAVIYPVVVNWTWGGGWLSTLSPAGYVDFAGSGVVHLTGGIAALVGAWIAGPREGRWRWDWPADFKPHNVSNVVIGTLILWFGWYGFNCGSTASMHSAENAALASVVAINTTLAAAASGCVSFILRVVIYRKADLTATCNGILAGLVSITAPCANVEFGAAMIVGIIGGLLYSTASWVLLNKLQIDDPVDAFAVHGACGAWGVIAAALFDWGEGVNHAHGASFTCIKDADSNECLKGLWIQLLGTNVLAVVVIMLWSGCWTIAIFGSFHFFGILTSPLDVQDQGMDQQACIPEKGLNVPVGIVEKKREHDIRLDRDKEKERVENLEAIKQLFENGEKPDHMIPVRIGLPGDASNSPQPAQGITQVEADQRSETSARSRKSQQHDRSQVETDWKSETSARSKKSQQQEPGSSSKAWETEKRHEATPQKEEPGQR